MSRDFDDIRKKIDQSHKDLYKQEEAIAKDINHLDKNQDKMLKEIADIKKEVKDIAFKVDTMLDILNSFTIMLAEDDEDLEENYTNNYDDDESGSWVPEQDEDWSDYDEEDNGNR